MEVRRLVESADGLGLLTTSKTVMKIKVAYIFTGFLWNFILLGMGRRDKSGCQSLYYIISLECAGAIWFSWLYAKYLIHHGSSNSRNFLYADYLDCVKLGNYDRCYKCFGYADTRTSLISADFSSIACSCITRVSLLALTMSCRYGWVKVSWMSEICFSWILYQND